MVLSRGPRAGATFLTSQTGTFIARVTNGAGCSSSDTAFVIAAQGISLSFPSDTLSLCGGGSVMLSPDILGGTSPYFYSWSTPQGVSNFDTIPASLAGTYFVTVTDAAGCSGTTNIILSISGQLNVLFSPVQPGFCPGDSVLLSALATGGTGAITYSWTTPGGPVVAPQVWAKISGFYSVNVVDQGGCTGSDNQTVVAYTSPVIQIDPVNTSICAGQTINILATGSAGQAPYQFVWSGPTGPATGPQISTNQAGTYSVTVTDDHGCEQTASSDITVASPITISIDPLLPLICSGSSISITGFATGGNGPYTFHWSGPNFSATQNPVIIDAGGMYTVTVSDQIGCTASLPFDVAVGAGLNVQLITSADTLCQGQPYTVEAQPTGGTLPYLYAWTTPEGSFSNTLINLNTPGIFRVTVTDAMGCTGVAGMRLSRNSSACPS
ncbi:MAG: hypothetical protein IPJ06_06420 [Saprospiraceae bacterium]|nr:hypothetical protein [Saprospiraceae bacterium]